MRLQSTSTFILCIVVALSLAGAAHALDASDYGWVRILEPPDEHPNADCEDYAWGGNPCGAGPGKAGGITNAGDVVGQLETNHPYAEPGGDLGRWLRSNGYKGENMRRPDLIEGAMYTTGGGNLIPYPGPASAPRAFGFIRARKVTSDGFMYGSANPIGVRYDILNDVWWGFGRGHGATGNNQGRLVSGWKAPGATFGANDSRVAEAKLVSTEPIDPDVTGNLQTFPSAPFGPASIFSNDINDNDIIAGSFDNTGAGFPTKADPIIIRPDGEDHWSDEHFVMDELEAESNSRATRISDGPNPIAIGWSTVGPVHNIPHGVLWDVTTGELKVDFGADVAICTNFWYCGPSAINSAGNMVVGGRLTGEFGFPAPREHYIAWSDDGWDNWQEIIVDEEFLAGLDGGEHIDHVTRLTGVNDSGQVSAQAIIKGAFGQYLTPGVSDWDPAVATNPACPNSDDGKWVPGNGCGIPIILDTLSLGAVVLKGDVSNDAIVDFLDITPFVHAQSAEGDEEAFFLLTPDGCFLCADIDMDGVVDFLDITPFVVLLDELGAAAVPEPATLALMVGFVAAGCFFRRTSGSGK